jgi:hypothetical protein
MATAIMRKPPLPDDVVQIGPAMAALPNDKWRLFVYYYVTGKPGYGALARAVRKAGFAVNAKWPGSARQWAWQMSHDPRIIAAITEENKKYIRVLGPAATHALSEMVRDSTHPGHARAVEMVIARTDPPETRHQIDVTHHHKTLDEEAIAALQTLRGLNASRQQLIDFFGEAGLRRYEAMVSEKATVIEGNVIEEAATS